MKVRTWIGINGMSYGVVIGSWISMITNYLIGHNNLIALITLGIGIIGVGISTYKLLPNIKY